MSLRSDIANYYFAHLDELSADKQFHIGNRLTAWYGDPRARAILVKQRDMVVPSAVTDDALVALFKDLLQFEPPTTISGYAMRKPYFDKYPRLTGIHHAILRLRHLHTVYGIDARPAFASVVPINELRELEDALAKDQEATRILSTYAINTLYLFHLIILEDDNIDAQALYDLGQSGYDTSSPEQLRLLIYMYTHCIIAASNFYTKELPAEALPVYAKMMQSLEAHIEQHFDEVSLDTKVEFWVCCRVVHYDTRLAERIDAECAASVCPEGTFIIDKHNIFARLQAKNSFADSEHRNTLFILSGSPYSPHSTRVN